MDREVEREERKREEAKDKEERERGRKERDGRERGRQRKEEIFLRALMEILRIVTFLLLRPLSLCLKQKHFLASMTGLQGGWPSLRLVLLLKSHMCVQHPRWCPSLVSAGNCPVRLKP